MKNATPAELSVLRARADRIARLLPQLSPGEDGKLDTQSRSAFAAQAQAILRRYRAVGASLILCLPGGQNEVFTFGRARLNPELPVTQNTCMRIASVSKLVMTFAVLSMAEDGLLDLDLDISSYLGYPVRSPHAPETPITMRMLLTHTSGITDDGPYGTRGMEAGCTLRELLDAPESWHKAMPGESFCYSNLGAGAAGVVMECAAGIPFVFLAMIVFYQRPDSFSTDNRSTIRLRVSNVGFCDSSHPVSNCQLLRLSR